MTQLIDDQVLKNMAAAIRQVEASARAKAEAATERPQPDETERQAEVAIAIVRERIIAAACYRPQPRRSGKSRLLEGVSASAMHVLLWNARTERGRT